MKEIDPAVLDGTAFVEELGTDTNFLSQFPPARELPAELAPLNEISLNYYWSWNPDGVELFRELDPALWLSCEQNPRLLLRGVSELRLLQKADDLDYVKRVSDFAGKMRGYLSELPAAYQDITTESPVAYFCAEYGVHNSLPTYSGGLGILAGDHLKSASGLGLPLVAVGLLYRYGYFRQRVGHDGWQKEIYTDIFDSELALAPVFGPEGDRLTVQVSIRGRDVFAQAWRAEVGRVAMYLLDTNLPQNAEIDRLITGHLYGGDPETRIVQEMVLGIGGVRLLRLLGIEPSVFHLNEGHSAFLTLELAREIIRDNPEASFSEARERVREKCVFTTHTPVSAGNDTFVPSDLLKSFDEGLFAELKLDENGFLGLGRIDPDDNEQPFGMTPLALRMCRSSNGVSKKHGEVSRDLWKEMFPESPSSDSVPISHVTNGVHPSTWIAPIYQRVFENDLGPDWLDLTADGQKFGASIAPIDNRSIWEAHLKLKRQLVAFLRGRTQRTDAEGRETINEHLDTHALFSPDVLTIGFARRVAAYKRWNLILADLDRLLRLVDDKERPVQFVFAGKAHPQDRAAKQILQDLMSINHDSGWQTRAVFIEDYDQEVARYLVRGVDVWMNVPRRPLEASGTSGMKAAMNGVLNLSILDGWWIEGFNGRNGFAIGGIDVTEDEDQGDAQDAEALYSALENDVVPAYYDRDAGGLPQRWIAMMKDSIATLTPQFSSDRMVREYISQIYRRDKE